MSVSLKIVLASDCPYCQRFLEAKEGLKVWKKIYKTYPTIRSWTNNNESNADIEKQIYTLEELRELKSLGLLSKDFTVPTILVVSPDEKEVAVIDHNVI